MVARTAPVWALLAASTMLASCDTIKHRVTFKDSEGRVFETRCGRKCRMGDVITTDAGPPQPSGAGRAGDEPGWVLSGNARYLTVCAAWRRQTSESDASAGWGSDDCRLVACGKDQPCPGAEFMDAPVCIDGYCGDPSRELESQDITALCLAGTGPERSPRSELQLKRHDLAAMACAKGTCAVPPECQP